LVDLALVLLAASLFDDDLIAAGLDDTDLSAIDLVDDGGFFAIGFMSLTYSS